MWCLQRDIHLVAQHLQEKLNVIYCRRGVKGPVCSHEMDDPAVSIRKDRQEDESTESGFISILVDSSASTVLLFGKWASWCVERSTDPVS